VQAARVMAYKDEYEVARLHTDAVFLAKVKNMFEGDFKLNYHLAPPLLARKNDKGELQKSTFGPWVRTGFRVLASMKGLRGGALDVFGRTEERRSERALIAEYRAVIDAMIPTLSAANLDDAAAFARVPEQIRGYGHVKARHLVVVRTQWAKLVAQYHQPRAQAPAQAA